MPRGVVYLGCFDRSAFALNAAASSVLLSSDQVELLARHRLLKPLLRQMVVAEFAALVPVTTEDCQQALEPFLRKHNLSSEEDLQAFLRLNLLHRDELELQLVQPWRLQRYVTKNYMPKAEARFLQRKDQLDRVIYSLMRLEDAGLARELYLRISEGESDFAELASNFAEGPERTTRGVVGPVPLTQAHPILAERLRTSKPGVVMEPFRAGKWWLVVRLESYIPATLNGDTAQQMARELFEEAVDEAVLQRIHQLIPLRFPEA